MASILRASITANDLQGVRQDVVSMLAIIMSTY